MNYIRREAGTVVSYGAGHHSGLVVEKKKSTQKKEPTQDKKENK